MREEARYPLCTPLSTYLSTIHYFGLWLILRRLNKIEDYDTNEPNRNSVSNLKQHSFKALLHSTSFLSTWLAILSRQSHNLHESLPIITRPEMNLSRNIFLALSPLHEVDPRWANCNGAFFFMPRSFGERWRHVTWFTRWHQAHFLHLQDFAADSKARNVLARQKLYGKLSPPPHRTAPILRTTL